MGYGLGWSMLYLEARCTAMVKAAGSQGVQNLIYFVHRFA